MSDVNWSSTVVTLATLTPLIGVPLTMITLYLKGIRDYQIRRYEDIESRVNHLDETMHGVSQTIRGFERDYTTKEEWLRESMHARQQLEKLTELVTRIQVEMENGNGLASVLVQATQAMVELTRALVQKGLEQSEDHD